MLKSFPSSLLALTLAIAPLCTHAQMERLASQIVDEQAQQIFYNSAAMGMALVVIDNDQVVNRSFGETRPGSGVRPHKDSLVRIASISKLMTSEVMVKLAAEGKLKLSDPLQKYAPKGATVPAYSVKQPITLLHLATHTSGLPREQPNRPEKQPVFTWPTRADRWQWLKRAQIKTAPGVSASYSNLAYDLLADALARAGGKSYNALLREKVTVPLGMKDTTFSPSAEQCARLMVGYGKSSCRDTSAAVGSGGVYSTPQDMQRWMQQFLNASNSKRKATASQEQKFYFRRDQLVSLKGMDVAGQADALGLGWVYMAPHEGLPGIIQKTGGGGGFITYMAMIPEKNIGVFIVVTRTQQTKFSEMSNGVNQLVADLAANTR